MPDLTVITPDPRLLAEELRPLWVYATDEDYAIIRDICLRHSRGIGNVAVENEHALLRAMVRQLGSEILARRVLYSGVVIAWGVMLVAATPAAEPIRHELTIFSWTAKFIVPAVGTSVGWIIRQAYPWLAQLGGWERVNLLLRSNALATALGIAPRAAGGSILPIAVVTGQRTAPYAADALLTALSRIPVGVSSFSQLIATTRGRTVALEIAGAFLREAVEVTSARTAVAARVAGSVAFRALGTTFGTIFRALPVAGNILLFFDAFGLLADAFTIANVRATIDYYLKKKYNRKTF
jgi:hypothetical protein